MPHETKREEANETHEIEMCRDEQLDTLELLEEPILLQLFNLVNFDPAELDDEQGNLKPFVELPERLLQGIANVQFRIISGKNDDAGRPVLYVQITMRFRKKSRALIQLTKHFDKVDIYNQLWLSNMRR